MLAVKILMEAVVVARTVLQQQRSWPELVGRVAAIEEISVVIAD